jgi:hypothetical protein
MLNRPGTPVSPDWTVFRVLPDAFHMRNALSFSGGLCDATRAIHLFADHRRVDWSGGEFKLNELAYEMS